MESMEAMNDRQQEIRMQMLRRPYDTLESYPIATETGKNRF